MKIDKVWVIFDRDVVDGPYIFLSKKEANKTLRRWKEEYGDEWIKENYLGPFKYVLEQK